MEDKNRNLLDEVIEKELEKLKSFDGSDEEKAKKIANMRLLYELRNEDEKIKVDKEHKRNQRSVDRSMGLRQQRSHEIEILLGLAVQLGIVILNCKSYDCWLTRVLHFEKYDTVGSPMGKYLLSRLTPKK